MTKALPFTEASIRRAISGARKAGLHVIGIEVRPDGTIVVRTGEDSAPQAEDHSLLSKWADEEI